MVSITTGHPRLAVLSRFEQGRETRTMEDTKLEIVDRNRKPDEVAVAGKVAEIPGYDVRRETRKREWSLHCKFVVMFSSNSANKTTRQELVTRPSCRSSKIFIDYKPLPSDGLAEFFHIINTKVIPN